RLARFRFRFSRGARQGALHQLRTSRFGLARRGGSGRGRNGNGGLGGRGGRRRFLARQELWIARAPERDQVGDDGLARRIPPIEQPRQQRGRQEDPEVEEDGESDGGKDGHLPVGGK